MNTDEQVTICKVIAKSCMWGQGGIASVILDGLQKEMPLGKGWQTVYSENSRDAQREAVGVITDENELLQWLSRGYWLTNYQPGEIALFNPPPMNGLCKYVVGELAEKYGKLSDPWNFRVYEKRAGESA